MILTDYEQEMFENLDRISGFNWYTIQQDRKDKQFLIDAIKTRIDIKGDFEFNDEYTKFRRIEPFSEFIKRVDGMFTKGSIGYSIEWHDHKDVEFNYDHLPEAQLKTYSSKEWEKKKGRV